MPGDAWSGGSARPVEPDTPTDSPAYIGWQLRDQARACGAFGSTLYAAVLIAAAEDAEAAGPVHRLLRPHAGPGRNNALALRFMAALHRLALTGRAPALAARYPSTGGDGDAAGAARIAVSLCEERAPELGELVALPCQTNEVGRAAGLAVGFLAIAAWTEHPMRLLEVGASAGLNLRWDRFRYGTDAVAWGPADSPVDLRGHWLDAPPLPPAVRVTQRAGCDPNPVDPGSDEGRLALTAAIWADQEPRLARLRGALRVAAAVPAEVERASVDAWLSRRLAQREPGTVTVVYQSVVEEYLSPAVRQAFAAAVSAAASRATADAPLAWLRMEPVAAIRRHGVRLTCWPGGEERLLASCGAHGQDVRLNVGGRT